MTFKTLSILETHIQIYEFVIYFTNTNFLINIIEKHTVFYTTNLHCVNLCHHVCFFFKVDFQCII